MTKTRLESALALSLCTLIWGMTGCTKGSSGDDGLGTQSALISNGIDDDQDGDNIDASRFTAGDKVTVQAWFGSYVFTDKSGKTTSGPTFRLLKL